MKMAVQKFDVFKVFLENLQILWGQKNAYFCRKEAKVAQRSTFFGLC